MMKVITQWQITIDFKEPYKQIEILISDDHYSNMLRKLSEISFPMKYEVTRIIIEKQS